MADHLAGLPALPQRVAAGNGAYAPTLPDFNEPRQVITGIIDALGANPESTYATLAARLAAIETAVAAGGGGGGGGGNISYHNDQAGDVALLNNAWVKVTQFPSITPQGSTLVISMSGLMEGNSGYPQKTLLVKGTVNDTAPADTSYDGNVVAFQASVDRYAFNRQYTATVTAGVPVALRVWMRFADYDAVARANNLGVNVTLYRKPGYPLRAVIFG